jgi:hypothetical protein
MGRLIKTFPDGHVVIAHNFVHAPGYSLFVADYSVEGHVQDGWYYVADDIEDESLALPWAQPAGPDTAYALGAVVSHNGTRWRSTIVGNVWEPGVSGWADADTDTPAWIQPTGAHDAYSLGALVKHNGDIWTSTLDANVWEPGVTGWRKAAIVPPDGGVPITAWVQPLGAHDAYPLGARVTHVGSTWESIVDANVWEPGVYGWVEV